MRYLTPHSEFEVISNHKGIAIGVGVAGLAAFKELIQRGTNLWPDAPPEIKAMADLVLNDGVIQQDYHAQDTSAKAAEHRKIRVQQLLLGKGFSYDTES